MTNDKYNALFHQQYTYSSEEIDRNNAMQQATRVATGQILPADIPIEDLIDDDDIRDLTGETEIMIAPVLMLFQTNFRGQNNKYTILSISLVRHPKHWKDNDVHHMPLEMHRFVDVYSDGSAIPTTIQYAQSIEYIDRLVKNYARIYTMMGYEVYMPVQEEQEEPSEVEALTMQAGLSGFASFSGRLSQTAKLLTPYPECVLYRPHKDEERRIRAITKHLHTAFVDNIHTAMVSKIGTRRGSIVDKDKIGRLKELGIEFEPEYKYEGNTAAHAEQRYKEKYGDGVRRSARMPSMGDNPCGEIDLR